MHLFSQQILYIGTIFAYNTYLHGHGFPKFVVVVIHFLYVVTFAQPLLAIHIVGPIAGIGILIETQLVWALAIRDASFIANDESRALLIANSRYKRSATFSDAGIESAHSSKGAF